MMEEIENGKLLECNPIFEFQVYNILEISM